ncbi:CBF-domain-containing protein [Mollisia scopiformis]|uniref:CBF-domain-containing protein n=1 Tax=Mollisia scopiformis TaxID=149040 RepID=A0A194XJE8_MOLSC|nr:CBF-domain-containing protein [Mollisia scopiformis]KUJ20246.1 CBF-domain-containing protein [Mollisia scopiformis]
MAKKRSKNSKAATGAGPSTDGDIPLLNEEALSALTARIESGLGTSNAQQESHLATNRDHETRDKLSKESKATSKIMPTETPRGTKRDANGNAKLAGQQLGNSRNSTHQSEQTGDARNAMLEEIIALGGTEEDLDLILDVASDEEADSSAGITLDKSFRKELASFVSQLGIEPTTNSTEADAASEDSEDDWEAASASDASEGSSTRMVEAVKEQQPSTTTRRVAAASGNVNHLIFEARPDWHATPLPTLPTSQVQDTSEYRHAVASLKDYAKSLLEADSNLYASKHLSSSSSHRFLSTIMASGTLSDKVSALTLVVQESPVHTTKSFESLLTLAKKRSRGQAVTALGALKDLLGAGVVLPADRRLRTFATQPGLLSTLQQESLLSWRPGQSLPGDLSKAHLIYWAYEDWLKESYFDMLKVLEGWCNDEVEYARSRAVSYVYELLKEKPEQEANLLRLLVNKLGDPDKKIASRASYLLLQLQVSHPLMKSIIIRSVETELLLRPGQSSHAIYYAINTLNQTILSAKEEDVAMKLLDIYFAQFVSLLKKPEQSKVVDAPVTNRKGQIQGGGAPMGKKAKARVAKEEEAKLISEETTEKLISAVLTGVNRAFPFSQTDDLTLEKHMDTLFKITHSSNFNTSIQALMLIEQLATTKHLAVDRFYRTLYESLLDPRLVTSSKHALYLNLLFRALKADLNVKRVKAFAKRMLQVVTLHQAPFICGVLYLLRELETIFPALKSLLTESEEGDDDEEEIFRDVPEDGEISKAQSTNLDPLFHRAPYDGRKRDPEHSNADKSCLWESIPFLVHFHPSVSLFASRLLNNEKLPPKPDLASHTLSSFLDRFVYRNAKTAASGPKGGSIMQPLSGGDSRGILLSSRNGIRSLDPLNTENFWHKKAEDVAVDEVFFHRYFSKIGKSKEASGKKISDSRMAEDENGEEDQDEDEIWQALVDSRPEVEGPSDDDSDMEMLDLEDSDVSVNESEVESEGEVASFEDTEDEEGDSDGLYETMTNGSGAELEVDDLFARELQTAAGEPEEETGKQSGREKRRKLKSLPTFASAEDYAEMLDNDEDEDFGGSS